MQQSPTNGTASAGAVYVQTNAAPNEMIAFRRAPDGSLDRIASVATGGDGGRSRGELTLERDATRAALHAHPHDAGGLERGCHRRLARRYRA